MDPTTSDSFRINDSLAIDHVYTASPGWLLNVRGGLTRFESKGSRAAEGVFDAATLGFPPATTGLFAETGYLPQFNITNFNPNTGGGTVGGPLSGRQVFDLYSFQPTVTSVRGHDLDGHHWEVMWMDPKAVEAGPEAYMASQQK